MKDINDEIRRRLTQIMAPRIVTPSLIEKLAADSGKSISARGMENYASRFIKQLEDEGAVIKVRAGLYLNQLCDPKATLPEAAQHLREGAIVSLGTVLGDSGVLNNYSYQVSSIIPYQSGDRSKSGTDKFGSHVFHFHNVQADILDAVTSDPDLKADAFDLGFAYPRATKEAALCHYAYLAQNPKSRIPNSQPDMDPDLLDMERLERLMPVFGVEEIINQWIATARENNDYADNLPHPF